jgi:hypothetical protein
LPAAGEQKQDALELIREVIGGAARESCMYSTSEIVDNTWHCCDWSEWVRKAAELLGIELPKIENTNAPTEPETFMWADDGDE